MDSLSKYLLSNSSTGRIAYAVTGSALVWEVRGSNSEPAKSNTELANSSPPLQLFFKRSCVAQAQGCDEGPSKLLTRLGVIQRV